MVDVWGREDLTCPATRQQIRRLVRMAYARPWRGDTTADRSHCLDTTAITEPGRLTRIMYTLDYGYHASGWFANSDYERCLHLSVSHPRPDLPVEVRQLPADLGPGAYAAMRTETPNDDEVRAWGLVLFREHATKAWFEPAVGPNDPYRAPNVVHLRLYLDRENRPILPRGEVYDLRPWDDGTSPAKITEGRAGADVR
ncbi:hypothetical protein DQ384_05125 [Sphaerisporangium album]|uniref:Uncharacterized protein n=1 Tax=Sphaerisporangium album TaxID=509200 RepID=A0A367FNI0_9ACTN|nr:hypothetical protein [Sphaerisporangium album]RCG31928.1 hypothetical protein DQ384_05125 [Sphaerisporangium album]